MKKKVMRCKTENWTHSILVQRTKREWATFVKWTRISKTRERNCDVNSLYIPNELLRPLIAALQDALKESEGK